jgi:hypothetical protein
MRATNCNDPEKNASHICAITLIFESLQIVLEPPNNAMSCGTGALHDFDGFDMCHPLWSSCFLLPSFPKFQQHLQFLSTSCFSFSTFRIPMISLSVLVLEIFQLGILRFWNLSFPQSLPSSLGRSALSVLASPSLKLSDLSLSVDWASLSDVYKDETEGMGSSASCMRWGQRERRNEMNKKKKLK